MPDIQSSVHEDCGRWALGAERTRSHYRGRSRNPVHFLEAARRKKRVCVQCEDHISCTPAASGLRSLGRPAGTPPRGDAFRCFHHNARGHIASGDAYDVPIDFRIEKSLDGHEVETKTAGVAHRQG